MVSVIIPTHNRSRFVKEAVDSVLAQEGDVSMEVIVVDDGSTDDTAAVLHPYGPAIRRAFQARKGVSAARNLGAEMARGQWLAFLDSDDLWVPGKLKAQMGYMEYNPHLKISQTGEIWVRNGKRINPKKYHGKPSGHCFPLLLERCLVSPSSVLLCADLFRELQGFDETLPACEDYDLWLRIGYRHPIGLLDSPLVVKRGGHDDQLSFTTPALDALRIKALVKLLLKEPLAQHQQRSALDVLRVKCRIYGEGCRKRGRLDEAAAMINLPGSMAKALEAGGNSKGLDQFWASFTETSFPFL